MTSNWAVAQNVVARDVAVNLGGHRTGHAMALAARGRSSSSRSRTTIILQGWNMNFLVAICPICEESIWTDISDWESTDRDQTFEAAAVEHLRTHPDPIQERFWSRRFLGDVRRAEWFEAARHSYRALRAICGDQDARGVYTIEEALGSASLHRFWMEAVYRSDRSCQNVEVQPSPARRLHNKRVVTWHFRLLGCILPPPDWQGTPPEWRQLANAVKSHCTCASHSGSCPAHQLRSNPVSWSHLVFGRRLGIRLQREEFISDMPP